MTIDELHKAVVDHPEEYARRGEEQNSSFSCAFQPRKSSSSDLQKVKKGNQGSSKETSSNYQIDSYNTDLWSPPPQSNPNYNWKKLFKWFLKVVIFFGLIIWLF